MINNRQGGRRRGRGGGGRPPGSNNPGPGNNRQDNRQRGNAAQLLEKYKGLARDAQMQGDRVQTEYFLQFADHYFRVLNENRARFEEQRRSRDDEYADEDEGDEDLTQEAAEGQGETDEPEIREERPRREAREDRGPRNGEYRDRERSERPRRTSRPRRDEEGDNVEQARGDEGERIAFDVLPPSISAANETDAEEAPARAPRARRPRRPRGEAEEVAPAA